MHEFAQSLAAVFTALIGLAILATVLGKNAQTTGVIQALSTGLASDLKAAEAPVT